MAEKLDLYKIFCQVARHGSFTRAAQALYMSQSAVSQAILNLESELGVQLFNRTPRGVTLTPEGSLLLEYAQSALSLIEAGEQKLAEFVNISVGELKIGVGDTISKYFLLPFLETFHIQYPTINFKIINGTTPEICTLVKTGKLDLGLCNFPIHDSALQRIPCLEVRDIFVCGYQYRFLSQQKTSLEELVRYPLIMLEPGSNSRKYVEDFLLSRGIRVHPEFELGSHDLLLEFARINLGVACVTKQFARDYLEREYVYEIPVVPSIPPRAIGICYLKSVSLSPASARFVELVAGGDKQIRARQ